MKYYSKIEYAPLYELLRQDSINNEKTLMVFSDSIWRECPNNSRSTGAYFVFHQNGPIDHCTYVPGSVSHYSAESSYNLLCTSIMSLAHIRMINNELLSTDIDLVT